MSKSVISRRDFLKSAAVGAAGVAAVSLSGLAGAASYTAADVEWNALYDVVVVGFGGAGAVAAVTAAENGAKVLLIDKAPKGHEGGNTRYAMQPLLSPLPENLETAIDYYMSLRQGFLTPNDEVIRALLEKMTENRYWLTDHGANWVEASVYRETEYSGVETMVPLQIDGETFTSKLWKFLRNLALSMPESIEIWYETPAVGLIRNPESGVLAGVKVEVKGELVNVRAKNGVVLSCGGFENNQEMIQNYTDYRELYALGSLYNTGDGIRMASEVGAQLWHMSNVMGPLLNIMNPRFARPHLMTGNMSQFHPYRNAGMLIVGADGTRFINEAAFAAHGYTDFHGYHIHTPVSLPMYMIFDEKTRLSQRFGETIPLGCARELEDGSLIKAGSITDMAQIIQVPVEALEDTIAEFNAYCEGGRDLRYGRDIASMAPIDPAGPYYAFELKCGLINTQGGPRRNGNAEILDTAGDVIPHFYGAGECGELYSRLYHGAGNLAGNIAWGRIAGENAAMEKTDDVPGEDIVAKPYTYAVEEERYEAGENQYIGASDGMCGDVVVRVTLTGDGIIGNVEILKNMETDAYGALAIEDMTPRFIGLTAEEVLGVDDFAGATVTSNALKAAVVTAIA